MGPEPTMKIVRRDDDGDGDGMVSMYTGNLL